MFSFVMEKLTFFHFIVKGRKCNKNLQKGRKSVQKVLSGPNFTKKTMIENASLHVLQHALEL